jgi:hypothetical protein
LAGEERIVGEDLAGQELAAFEGFEEEGAARNFRFWILGFRFEIAESGVKASGEGGRGHGGCPVRPAIVRRALCRRADRALAGELAAEAWALAGVKGFRGRVWFLRG